MLTELLQDRAALYVAGALAKPERESFELVLEFHIELRAHVEELRKVAVAMVLAEEPRPTPGPPPDLKQRILRSLETHPGPAAPEALVVAGTAGTVEWVNPAFTAMCGYSLDELKGSKPGRLLQGPETDPGAVQRIRESLRERRSCRETLVNYHKDGTPYQVDVAITPILDDDGEPLWFVAQERKLASVRASLSARCEG